MTLDNDFLRPGSTRLSRRTVLRGGVLGAAGLSAAALIGCGDDDDAVATTTLSGLIRGHAEPVSLTVTRTADTNEPPPSGSGIVGTLPASGFGLVTFGGTIEELRDELATACPSGKPIFATSGGEFVGFFPTAAITAVNAPFIARFPGGVIPSGTPLLGGTAARAAWWGAPIPATAAPSRITSGSPGSRGRRSRTAGRSRTRPQSPAAR